MIRLTMTHVDGGVSILLNPARIWAVYPATDTGSVIHTTGGSLHVEESLDQVGALLQGKPLENIASTLESIDGALIGYLPSLDELSDISHQLKEVAQNLDRMDPTHDLAEIRAALQYIGQHLHLPR